MMAYHLSGLTLVMIFLYLTDHFEQLFHTLCGNVIPSVSHSILRLCFGPCFHSLDPEGYSGSGGLHGCSLSCMHRRDRSPE